MGARSRPRRSGRRAPPTDRARARTRRRTWTCARAPWGRSPGPISSTSPPPISGAASSRRAVAPGPRDASRSSDGRMRRRRTATGSRCLYFARHPSALLVANGEHTGLGSAEPRVASLAEADGNRTRQGARRPLVGFEDRGAHQEPRRLRFGPYRQVPATTRVAGRRRCDELLAATETVTERQSVRPQRPVQLEVSGRRLCRAAWGPRCPPRPRVPRTRTRRLRTTGPSLLSSDHLPLDGVHPLQPSPPSPGTGPPGPARASVPAGERQAAGRASRCRATVGGPATASLLRLRAARHPTRSPSRLGQDGWATAWFQHPGSTRSPRAIWSSCSRQSSLASGTTKMSQTMYLSPRKTWSSASWMRPTTSSVKRESSHASTYSTAVTA